MIRLAMTLSVSAFGLGFLAVNDATAEPIPVAWSYRNPFNEIAFPNGATGGLAFPNTEFQSFKADQTIIASILSSYSIARETQPDFLRSQSYAFALDLRDDASGDVARLEFKGVLSGDLWRTGTNLSNVFMKDASQIAVLGGYQYIVSLVDFHSPSGYGETKAGSISARVSIGQPIEELPMTDSPPNTTPEPATLVMVVLGITGTGMFRLRWKEVKINA